MISLHRIACKVACLTRIGRSSAAFWFRLGILILSPIITLGLSLGKFLLGLLCCFPLGFLGGRFRCLSSSLLGRTLGGGANGLLAQLGASSCHAGAGHHGCGADGRVHFIALGQVDQRIGAIGHFSHTRDQPNDVQAGVNDITAPALPPALFFLGGFDRWRAVANRMRLGVWNDLALGVADGARRRIVIGVDFGRLRRCRANVG